MQPVGIARVARYFARLLIIQIPAWILLSLYLGLVAIDRLEWTTIAVPSFVGVVLSMVVEISYKLLCRKIPKATPRRVLTSAILIGAGSLWYLPLSLIVGCRMGFSLEFPWRMLTYVANLE